MSQQGMRGPDKKKRKPRAYPARVIMEIRVPQEVADWLRHDGKPSRYITQLIQQKIKHDNRP